MFAQATIVTLFAGLAAAQIHAPVGQPSGNPITRPLNEIVPACKPFTITWTPTTPNTVSVLLLKGPATNVVKFGPSIAEGIANSGSLVWTPSADLTATTSATGYGIQLIDDVTGVYQYSTQFGINTDGCVVSSSSAVASSAAASSAAAAAASTSGGYYAVSSSAAVYSASASKSASVYSTAVAANSTAPFPTTVRGTAYSTGAPLANSTVVLPTKSMSVPSSLRASATGNATTSKLPEATGAASALQAGLGFAGAAVAFAFML